MEKFNTKRLFKLADLNDELLKFRLTKVQRARVPRGREIVFRKSTQPYKDKGYKHLVSRAEYTSTDPKKKGRAVSAASHLIGIIWDDDPEWVYETDKSKSSIAARRTAAVASKHKSSRLVTSMVASMFQENVDVNFQKYGTPFLN